MLEALARAPGGQLQSSAYRRDHGLAAASTVQKALATLTEDELVGTGSNGYEIAEPFLADWILQRGM